MSEKQTTAPVAHQIILTSNNQVKVCHCTNFEGPGWHWDNPGYPWIGADGSVLNA